MFGPLAEEENSQSYKKKLQCKMKWHSSLGLRVFYLQMCSLESNIVNKMHNSITVGLFMILHINMKQSLSMPKLMATNIKKYRHIHYCYKSLELCNLITLVFLAADAKVMAVGQPAGSVSVSYHTATFTVCTCMTSRLPSDPQLPH